MENLIVNIDVTSQAKELKAAGTPINDQDVVTLLFKSQTSNFQPRFSRGVDDGRKAFAIRNNDNIKRYRRLNEMHQQQVAENQVTLWRNYRRCVLSHCCAHCFFAQRRAARHSD